MTASGSRSNQWQELTYSLFLKLQVIESFQRVCKWFCSLQRSWLWANFRWIIPYMTILSKIIVAANLTTFLNSWPIISCAMSGWPSGLRRCVQVAVYLGRRGFESHFWHKPFHIILVAVFFINITPSRLLLTWSLLENWEVHIAGQPCHGSSHILWECSYKTLTKELLKCDKF